MKLSDFQALRKDLAEKTNAKGRWSFDVRGSAKTTLQLPEPPLVVHFECLRDALGKKLDKRGSWRFYKPNQTATTLNIETVDEISPRRPEPREAPSSRETCMDSKLVSTAEKEFARLDLGPEQSRDSPTPQQGEEAKAKEHSERRLQQYRDPLRAEANALLVGECGNPVQFVTAAWLRHLVHTRWHYSNPEPLLFGWYLDEADVRDRLRRWLLSKERQRTRYDASRDWLLDNTSEPPGGEDGDLMHAETELRYDWCYDQDESRRTSIYYCLDADEIKKEEAVIVRSVFLLTYKNILPKRGDGNFELASKADAFAPYLYEREYHTIYGPAGDQAVRHNNGQRIEVGTDGFRRYLPIFYPGVRGTHLFGRRVPFPSAAQLTPPDPRYPTLSGVVLDVAEIRTAMFCEPDFRYLDIERMDALYGDAVRAYVRDCKSFNPLRHLPKSPASYVKLLS